jgi:hypothetical protein
VKRGSTKRLHRKEEQEYFSLRYTPSQSGERQMRRDPSKSLRSIMTNKQGAITPSKSIISTRLDPRELDFKSLSADRYD